MIAVTIGVGSPYKEYAEWAAESCRARTGLDTYILDETHCEKYDVRSPLLLKLKLFDEFPDEEQIMYFDSDMVFLRKVTLEEHFRGVDEFICVTDRYSRSFIVDDANRMGIAPTSYFNGGWFIARPDCHRPLFSLAESLYASFSMPFLEQSALNWARTLLSVPTHFASKRFNAISYLTEDGPEAPYIGHLITVNIGHLEPEELRAIYEQLGGIRPRNP